ncbi:hypothetical protein BXZ70DRAFT_906702 [Cristinia sonorae]|uniref:Uncharacterized protein n=1 Tax=Cristinia sonorae TaxID=1940300 RepID=A0A8K0XRA5_9AGAR|nr:hypothetical protein BXZ70DRAFT_906702 [Cristinia sonorae]
MFHHHPRTRWARRGDAITEKILCLSLVTKDPECRMDRIFSRATTTSGVAAMPRVIDDDIADFLVSPRLAEEMPSGRQNCVLAAGAGHFVVDEIAEDPICVDLFTLLPPATASGRPVYRVSSYITSSAGYNLIVSVALRPISKASIDAWDFSDVDGGDATLVLHHDALVIQNILPAHIATGLFNFPCSRSVRCLTRLTQLFDYAGYHNSYNATAGWGETSLKVDRVFSHSRSASGVSIHILILNSPQAPAGGDLARSIPPSRSCRWVELPVVTNGPDQQLHSSFLDIKQIDLGFSETHGLGSVDCHISQRGIVLILVFYQFDFSWRSLPPELSPVLGGSRNSIIIMAGSTYERICEPSYDHKTQFHRLAIVENIACYSKQPSTSQYAIFSQFTGTWPTLPPKHPGPLFRLRYPHTAETSSLIARHYVISQNTGVVLIMRHDDFKFTHATHVQTNTTNNTTILFDTNKRRA